MTLRQFVVGGGVGGGGQGGAVVVSGSSDFDVVVEDFAAAPAFHTAADEAGDTLGGVARIWRGRRDGGRRPTDRTPGWCTTGGQARVLAEGNRGAAVDAFSAYWQRYDGSGKALLEGWRALSKACTAYAEKVEETRYKIDEMLAADGGVLQAGGALTILSGGEPARRSRSIHRNHRALELTWLI